MTNSKSMPGAATNLLRWLAPAAVLVLAGCEGIGSGTRLKELEILPTTGAGSAVPHRIYECFREGLTLVGRFSDGSAGNFTSRASWTSSNPEVVRVASGEERFVSLVDGDFVELDTLNYSRGTLIPVKPGTATITAEFIDRTATIEVEVRTPTLSVALASDASPTPPAVAYMGVGTGQRYTVVADLDGRIREATAPGSQDPIFNLSTNPVRWSFDEPGNHFVEGDIDAAEVDRFELSDDALDPQVTFASVTPATGVVGAETVDNNTYTVQAQFEPCLERAEVEPRLRATTELRVANFVTSDALLLQREEGFTGANLVVGTNELLRITARLDTDGNLATAEQAQDVSDQVRLDVEPKDSCVEIDGEIVCASSVFAATSNPPNLLQTAPGTSGGPGFIRACLPDCDDDATDPDDTPRVSNVVSIVGVLGRIAAIEIVPAAATEQAFTFPARQFEAIGHFDVGDQKITRFMNWFAQVPDDVEEENDDDTIEVSEVVSLGNNLLTRGRVTYLENVDTDTTVEIRAIPQVPFASQDEPAPALFTITPCVDSNPDPAADTCPLVPPPDAED